MNRNLLNTLLGNKWRSDKMQHGNIPDYLNNTVNMIKTAFPDGINQGQYFSLLYLLYDHMCDENLSIVMSHISGENIATVTNDIWGVNQRLIDNDCLLDTKDRLLKAGYALWINES
jgi:Protein of unknown function (DUF3349).